MKTHTLTLTEFQVILISACLADRMADIQELLEMPESTDALERHTEEFNELDKLHKVLRGSTDTDN